MALAVLALGLSRVALLELIKANSKRVSSESQSFYALSSGVEAFVLIANGLLAGVANLLPGSGFELLKTNNELVHSDDGMMDDLNHVIIWEVTRLELVEPEKQGIELPRPTVARGLGIKVQRAFETLHYVCGLIRQLLYGEHNRSDRAYVALFLSLLMTYPIKVMRVPGAYPDPSQGKDRADCLNPGRKVNVFEGDVMLPNQCINHRYGCERSYGNAEQTGRDRQHQVAKTFASHVLSPCGSELVGIILSQPYLIPIPCRST